MKNKSKRTRTRLSLADLVGLSLQQQRQKLLKIMENSEAAQEKFWSKVKKGGRNECWLWQGALYADGYGVVKMSTGSRSTYYKHYGFRAHRVSFFLKHGFLPDDLFICHKCDVPTCVNPKHLFVGNQQINMADKIQKSRQAIGVQHGRSKLTETQVIEARVRYHLEGESLTSIARRLGLVNSSTAAMLDGIHWKHLPMPHGIESPLNF